jgi:hypothetical protein
MCFDPQMLNAHKNFVQAKTLLQTQTSKTMSAIQGFLKNLQLQNEVLIVTDNAKAHRGEEATSNPLHSSSQESLFEPSQRSGIPCRWNDSNFETALSPKSPRRKNSMDVNNMDDPQAMGLLQCSVALESFFYPLVTTISPSSGNVSDVCTSDAMIG